MLIASSHVQLALSFQRCPSFDDLKPNDAIRRPSPTQTCRHAALRMSSLRLSLHVGCILVFFATSKGNPEPQKKGKKVKASKSRASLNKTLLREPKHLLVLSALSLDGTRYGKHTQYRSSTSVFQRRRKRSRIRCQVPMPGRASKNAWRDTGFLLHVPLLPLTGTT